MSLPENVIETVKHYLLTLQKNICNALETLDGPGRFVQDSWTREEGFGGVSCVLEKGKVFDNICRHQRLLIARSLPVLNILPLGCRS